MLLVHGHLRTLSINFSIFLCITRTARIFAQLYFLLKYLFSQDKNGQFVSTDTIIKQVYISVQLLKILMFIPIL